VARVATKAEAGLAAELLGRAFARDPVLVAFFQEDPVDPARLARYFELECRVALAGYGEVRLGDDRLGAALWRRPVPERAPGHTK